MVEVEPGVTQRQKFQEQEKFEEKSFWSKMETGHKKSSSIMISQSFEIRRVLEGRLKYIITISLKLFFFSPKIRLLCIIWRIPYKFLNWTQIGNPIFRWDIICNLMKRHLADWKTNLFTILAAYLLNPQNVQTSSKKYESKLKTKQTPHTFSSTHFNCQIITIVRWWRELVQCQSEF